MNSGHRHRNRLFARDTGAPRLCCTWPLAPSKSSGRSTPLSSSSSSSLEIVIVVMLLQFGSMGPNQSYTEGRTLSILICIFRDIRPPIPTTSAHLYRGIRPALTRCREALVFDISFLAFRHVVEGLSFGRIVRRVRAGRRCAPAGLGWHLRRWVHQ